MFDGLPEAPLRGQVLRLNGGTLSKDLIVLEECLAVSGEASVYATDRTDMAAKLYHAPSQARQQKLEAMMANPPLDPSLRPGHVSFAWPTHLLFDEDDRFVGFAMPRIVNARSATALASPKLRRKSVTSRASTKHAGSPTDTIGSATWFDLHATAANLAFIIARLHAAGFVLGDLKTDNILIDQANLVSLIDCDGFQICNASGSEVFPAAFVSEGYSAPELIGEDLSQAIRDPSADLFSLAVIIHKLLLGVHPHAGRWLPDGEPPSIDHIAALGVWIHNGETLLAAPASSPPSDIAASAVIEFFDKAFVAGTSDPSQRPKAEDWHAALCLAMSELVRCETVESHFHRLDLPCHWCESAERSGVELFPEPLADRDHIRPLIMTFERALARGDARMAVSLWRDHAALRRHKSAPDHVMRIREMGAAIDAVDDWLTALTPKDVNKRHDKTLLAAWQGLLKAHPILYLLEEEPVKDTAENVASKAENAEIVRKAAARIHAQFRSTPLSEKAPKTERDISVQGQGGRRKTRWKLSVDKNRSKGPRPIVGPLLAPPDKVQFVPPRDLATICDDTDAYLTYTLRLDVNERSERIAIVTITPSKPVETLPLRIVNRASGILIMEGDGVIGDSPIEMTFEAPIRPTTIALEYKPPSDTVSGAAPIILHPPVKERMIGTPSGKRAAKGPKLRELVSLGLASKGAPVSKN